MSIVKPNCFEKTKVRWGIFSFFSSINVETKNVCPIAYNGDNMKWLGFGATNLSHATKLTGSKLANKPTNTQLFYIMC